MQDASCKKLALLMTACCVRNTAIENYHANGQIANDEIKVFTKEISNKIYTFLELLINKPREEWEMLLTAMIILYQRHFDHTTVGTDFLKLLAKINDNVNLNTRISAVNEIL